VSSLTGAAALEGTLDELGLDELLGFLAAGSRTGTLSFGGRHAGVLTLRDGTLTLGLLDDGPSWDTADTIAEDVVVDHLLTLLARLLVVGDAPFSFIAHDDPPDHGSRLRLSLDDALSQAHDRADEWSRLRERVPDDDKVVVLRSTTDRSTVTLSSDQWSVVVAADGVRTVMELSHHTGLSLFATVRAVEALLVTGAADLA
jgi:hypothetical protein